MAKCKILNVILSVVLCYVCFHLQRYYNIGSFVCAGDFYLGSAKSKSKMEEAVVAVISSCVTVTRFM